MRRREDKDLKMFASMTDNNIAKNLERRDEYGLTEAGSTRAAANA